MAFDIMSMFGPQAVNRLLQPVQGAGGVPSFLANPQAAVPALPPPVSVGMPPQVAGPQPDPMQTASVAAPAPMQAAQPKAPGLGINKELLNDIFLGWAMGQTPMQSLAMGAAQASKGKSGRQDANATVEWLKGRGMDEGTARQLASQPTALADYLKQMVSPDKAKPLEINGKLVDPNTYQVIADYSDPKDPKDDRTATMRELEAAGLEPGTPEYNEALLANNRPKGMMIESDGQGGFKLVQGADVSGGANLNVEQGKNTGFLIRAQEANKAITELEGEGTSAWNKIAGAVPGVGNYLVGEDAQKLTQAKRDFINAQLRQESGAVISPEEFANAEQQYFPQPGDGPEVIAQKRRNRENAIAGFRIRSGPGAQAVDQMQPAQAPGGAVDYREYFGGQ